MEVYAELLGISTSDIFEYQSAILQVSTTGGYTLSAFTEGVTSGLNEAQIIVSNRNDRTQVYSYFTPTSVEPTGTVVVQGAPLDYAQLGIPNNVQQQDVVICLAISESASPGREYICCPYTREHQCSLRLTRKANNKFLRVTPSHFWEGATVRFEVQGRGDKSAIPIFNEGVAIISATIAGISSQEIDFSVAPSSLTMSNSRWTDVPAVITQNGQEGGPDFIPGGAIKVFDSDVTGFLDSYQGPTYFGWTKKGHGVYLGGVSEIRDDKGKKLKGQLQTGATVSLVGKELLHGSFTGYTEVSILFRDNIECRCNGVGKCKWDPVLGRSRSLTFMEFLATGAPFLEFQAGSTQIDCDLPLTFPPLINNQNDMFLGGSGWLHRRYPNRNTWTDFWTKYTNGNLPTNNGGNNPVVSARVDSNTQRDIGYNVGEIWEGFFKCPADAIGMKFYIAGDDKCLFYFNENQGKNNGGSSLQPAIEWLEPTWYQYYFQDVQAQSSKWFTCATQGDLHYMKIVNYNDGGVGHCSLAMETNGTNGQFPATGSILDSSTDILNLAPQVQRLSITSQYTRMKHTVQISGFYGPSVNADTANQVKYVITGLPNRESNNPPTKDIWSSETSYCPTASTFHNAIQGMYYYQSPRVFVSVVRRALDANGAATQTQADIRSCEFDIIATHALVGGGDAPRLEVDPNHNGPATVSTSTTEVSTAPITGTFTINLNTGESSETAPIKITDSSAACETKILASTSSYSQNIEIRRLYNTWASTDGVELVFVFKGVQSQLPAITANIGNLIGDAGANIATVHSHDLSYTSNRWFNPIIAEFVRVASDVPLFQMTISPGNQAGSGPAPSSAAVSGSFVDPAPQVIDPITTDPPVPVCKVTAISLSADFLTVTVQGENFDIAQTSIHFGTTNTQTCNPIGNATGLTCNFTQLPIIGTGLPVLVFNAQNPAEQCLPASGVVNTFDIVPTITSIVDNLSQASGNITLTTSEILITGTFLQPSVQIMVDGSPLCDTVQYVSLTQVICSNHEIPADPVDAQAGYVITATVSSQTLNTIPMTIDNTPAPQGIETLSPTIVSPVIPDVLTITQQGGPSPCDLTKLRITLNTPAGGEKFVLKAKSCTPTEIQVYYSYGDIGTYDVLVKYDGAYLPGNALTLTIDTYITGVSPSQGSLMGGTLITITGVGFSATKNQNQISVGGNLCRVIDASTTQLTCRTPVVRANHMGQLQDKTANVLVALRLYQISKCQQGSTCTFSYLTTQTPNVTAIAAPVWDTASQTYRVTFSGDLKQTWAASDIAVFIEGHGQPGSNIVVNNDGSITWSPTWIDTYKAVHFRVRFGNMGRCLFMVDNKIKFPLKFLGVSPSEGSAGGELVRFHVGGLGKYSGRLSVTEGNNVLCDRVNIKFQDFYYIECKINKAIGFQSGALKVKLIEFGKLNDIACTSENNQPCSYAVTSAATPKIASTSTDGNSNPTRVTITADTANQFPTGQTLLVNMNKQVCTIVSETASEIVCDVAKMEPGNVKPRVRFINGNNKKWAWFDSSSQLNANIGAALTNSITGASYGGGLTQTITGTNLGNGVEQGVATIEVCNRPCLSTNVVDKDTVECEIPPIITTAQMMKYKFPSRSVDFFRKRCSNTGAYKNARFLFDGFWGTGFKNTQAQCEILFDPRPGHTVKITRVQHFIQRATAKSSLNYIGAQLQGTDDPEFLPDGSANPNRIWHRILTLDGRHNSQGWTTIDIAQAPHFSFFRYFGPKAGACDLGEIQFEGVEFLKTSSLSTTQQCDVVVSTNQVTETAPTQVDYAQATSPDITAVNPQLADCTGNTVITITGTGFDPNSATKKVFIDAVECVISSITTTEIQCTAGANRQRGPGALKVFFGGLGLAQQRGNFNVVYFCKWSDPLTWGNFPVPMAQASVSIPSGQNVLYDVDQTATNPVVHAHIIINGGSLIFKEQANCNTKHYFHAQTVTVNMGGKIIAGNVNTPHCGNLRIVMHGKHGDPEVPKLGNKMIGVVEGSVELYGKPRKTWTNLAQTANVGDNFILVSKANSDYAVGETIVVAPTGFITTEEEVRVIDTVVDAGLNWKYTFVTPLAYKHYSNSEQHGPSGRTTQVDMLGEVAVLDRSIQFTGDMLNAGEHGAHIIVSQKTTPNKAEIRFVQFEGVGQAGRVNRQPVNFYLNPLGNHLNVEGCSFRNTYNRMVQIKSTNYARVTNNVGLRIKGHALIISDGVERANKLTRNLIIGINRGWNSRADEYKPAGIFVTHPGNDLVDNVVAGADFFGIWFKFRARSRGCFASTSICSRYSTLGAFDNNQVHTIGSTGLFIWPQYIPLQQPCQRQSATNPHQLSTFNNFKAWKIRGRCSTASTLGYVQQTNIICADVLGSGFYVSYIDQSLGDNKAMIDGATIVTKTNNFDSSRTYTTIGITAPRTEFFWIKNVFFFGFCEASMFPIETNAGAWHSWRSHAAGAITTSVAGIGWGTCTAQNAVSNRVKWGRYHRKDIIWDSDGTFTERAANQWVVPRLKYLYVPECRHAAAGSIWEKNWAYICDETVQVRRVSIYNPKPYYSMRYQWMKIVPFYGNGRGYYRGYNNNYKTWCGEPARLDQVYFLYYRNPYRSWTFPVVTGYRYAWWLRNGIDFDRIYVEKSVHWKQSDRSVVLETKFGARREYFNVFPGNKAPALPESNYPIKFPSGSNHINKPFLSWAFRNDTYYKNNFQFVVNHQDSKPDRYGRIDAVECIGGCIATVPVVNITDTVFWSDNPWRKLKSPSGKGKAKGKCNYDWDFDLDWYYYWSYKKYKYIRYPKTGDSVYIPPSMKVVLDVCPPVFTELIVDGILEFAQPGDVKTKGKDKCNKDTLEVVLQSQFIFVRGELIIGQNDTNRYMGNARIVLHGNQFGKAFHPYKAIKSSVHNKIMVISGVFRAHGAAVNTMSRLLAPATPDYSNNVAGQVSPNGNPHEGFVPTSDCKSKLEIKVCKNQHNQGNGNGNGPNGNGNGKAKGKGCQPKIKSSSSSKYAHCQAGSVLTVEANLGWENHLGEEVLITGTGYEAGRAEKRTILAYNKNNGELTVYPGISYYHDGAAAGVMVAGATFDNRARVELLTRTIIVEGAPNKSKYKKNIPKGKAYGWWKKNKDVLPWGGSILATDYDETNRIARQSLVAMSYVEIKNCAHRDNLNAALRFEYATTNTHTVDHVAIHSGPGFGFKVYRSNNVAFTNSVVALQIGLGVWIRKANHVQVSTSLVADMRSRPWEAMFTGKDLVGSFLICGLGERCNGLDIQKNEAAGDTQVCFVAPTTKCGQTNVADMLFLDNVAHGCPIGWFANRNSLHTENVCQKGEKFTAWKTGAGLITIHRSSSVQFSQIHLADNKFGISPLSTGGNADVRGKMIDISNSVIVGEAMPECTSATWCSNNAKSAACGQRTGLGMNVPYVNGGEHHIFDRWWNVNYLVPYHRSLYNGKLQTTNIAFHEFPATGACGATFKAVTTNKWAHDKTPIQYFDQTSFTNCDENNLFYFHSPATSAGMIERCEGRACTGLDNVLTQWTGTSQSPAGSLPAAFQLASNSAHVAAMYSCVLNSQYNAHICQNSRIGMLQFEDRSRDRYLVRYKPTIAANNFSVELNEFHADRYVHNSVEMRRLSRYPVLVTGGGVYDITYSTDAPRKQSFELFGLKYSDTALIRIKFLQPIAVNVFRATNPAHTKRDQWIRQPQSDLAPDGLGYPVDGANSHCGNWRFNAQTRELEMFMRGEFAAGKICRLYVNKKNSVATVLQLQIPLSQFFTDGGIAPFTDKMAATLGIDPSRIAVASCFQGSTIVHFTIEEQTTANGNSNPNTMAELSNIMSTLKKKALQGQLGLPYKVLSIQTSLQKAGSNNVQTTASAKKATAPIKLDRFLRYGVFVLLIVIPLVVAVIIRVKCIKAKKQAADFGNKLEDEMQDNEKPVGSDESPTVKHNATSSVLPLKGNEFAQVNQTDMSDNNASAVDGFGYK